MALNKNNPAHKAIYDLERILFDLTGTASPSAIITEDMSPEEMEMEIFAALLRAGIEESAAKNKAKELLKRMNEVEGSF